MFSSKLSFIDHNSGDKGVLRLDALKNTLQSCPDTFLKQEKSILNSRVKRMVTCLIDFQPWIITYKGKARQFNWLVNISEESLNQVLLNDQCITFIEFIVKIKVCRSGIWNF